MKKIILLPLLFFCVVSIAQEKFVVPELTDIRKQWDVTFQMNGMIINQINYAKTMGQTVEKLAQFSGNQFKLDWKKEKGWEGFANGCLRNWSVFRPDNKIEIIEQSQTMLKFKSKVPFTYLKDNGPIHNVTHQEYISFTKIYHEIIADYLGATILFEDVEKGIVLTIKKK